MRLSIYVALSMALVATATPMPIAGKTLEVRTELLLRL
jgi:hypothetical protein